VIVCLTLEMRETKILKLINFEKASKRWSIPWYNTQIYKNIVVKFRFLVKEKEQV